MKKRTSIWWIGLLGVLLLASGRQPARAQYQLDLRPESRLWIEGTSTVNAFTCTSEAVEGYGMLVSTASNTQRVSTAPKAAASQAEVVVPVESFDCGKSRMNRDFYKAMKAEAHPLIRYELEYADIISRPTSEDGLYQLRVVGRLTIAGNEKSITTTLYGQRLPNGRYHVEGSQPLLMTSFGIDPPSAMLGLVKAHDRILVRFDLVAESITTKTTTVNATQ